MLTSAIFWLVRWDRNRPLSASTTTQWRSYARPGGGTRRRVGIYPDMAGAVTKRHIDKAIYTVYRGCPGRAEKTTEALRWRRAGGRGQSRRDLCL